MSSTLLSVFLSWIVSCLLVQWVLLFLEHRHHKQRSLISDMCLSILCRVFVVAKVIGFRTSDTGNRFSFFFDSMRVSLSLDDTLLLQLTHSRRETAIKSIKECHATRYGVEWMPCVSGNTLFLSLILHHPLISFPLLFHLFVRLVVCISLIYGRLTSCSFSTNKTTPLSQDFSSALFKITETSSIEKESIFSSRATHYFFWPKDEERSQTKTAKKVFWIENPVPFSESWLSSFPSCQLLHCLQRDENRGKSSVLYFRVLSQLLRSKKRRRGSCDSWTVYSTTTTWILLSWLQSTLIFASRFRRLLFHIILL
jgi:hypothetical protein